MVRVVARNTIRIYVYAHEATERHHGGHCHIYWPDGSASVSIDDGRVLAGDLLPRGARDLFNEYWLRIAQVWEEAQS